MSFPDTAFPRSCGFVVGRGERAHLGEGWYDRLEWPDRPGMHYRTAQPRAEMRLFGKPGQRELRMLLTASLKMIGGPALVEIAAVRGDQESAVLGTLRLEWEDWAVHAVRCRVEDNVPLVFTLRTLTPCTPHETLGNGDHRALGIHLAAAHLC